MDKPQSVMKRPALVKLGKLSNNAALSNELEQAKVKVNLSQSCFGSITTEKKPLDLDLTNLNWLQNNNLLKGLGASAKAPCLSPPRDLDTDLTFIPGTQIQGGVHAAKSEHKISMPVGKANPRKPPYSFSSLIFMAIEDSPHKKLPVKDIYNWITERFLYFQSAPLGWKNSVRHNLSLNKCFMKVDKDKGQVCKLVLLSYFSCFSSVELTLLKHIKCSLTFPVWNKCGPYLLNNQSLSDSLQSKYQVIELFDMHRLWAKVHYGV